MYYIKYNITRSSCKRKLLARDAKFIVRSHYYD